MTFCLKHQEEFNRDLDFCESCFAELAAQNAANFGVDPRFTAEAVLKQMIEDKEKLVSQWGEIMYERRFREMKAYIEKKANAQT